MTSSCCILSKLCRRSNGFEGMHSTKQFNHSQLVRDEFFGLWAAYRVAGRTTHPWCRFPSTLCHFGATCCLSILESSFYAEYSFHARHLILRLSRPFLAIIRQVCVCSKLRCPCARNVPWSSKFRCPSASFGLRVHYLS